MKQLWRRYWKSTWAVPVTGLLLIFISIIGFFITLGPAIAAEAKYQVKSVARALGSEQGDWREVVVPNINFVMKPEAQIAEFGIVIPKIFVNEKVIANVDPTDKAVYTPALREGIAHAAGTGLPGDGQQGYYFAHSSEASLHASQLNAVFYLLGKLEPGDEVQLWKDGEEHVYTVTESMVTDPKDLSFLSPEAETETIALQTCWPVGTSLRRLIVIAKKVS